MIYRGEILYSLDGNRVRGQWEPILTEEEYEAVTAKWKPTSRIPSRLGAIGGGYGNVLPAVAVPAVREMQFADAGRAPEYEERASGVLPVPGQGPRGMRQPFAAAAPVNEYIKALVIAEQQKIEFRKLDDLPPWPKAQELADLQARIDESTRRYEKGEMSSERYWPSLARMEADEAELKRERRQYEGQQQRRIMRWRIWPRNGTSRISRWNRSRPR